MESPMKSRKSRDAIIASIIIGVEAGLISYFDGSAEMIQTICGITAGLFGITIMSQGHADANDAEYGKRRKK